MPKTITVELTEKQKRMIVGSIQNQLYTHHNDLMCLPDDVEDGELLECYKKWIKIKSRYDEILKIFGAKEWKL